MGQRGQLAPAVEAVTQFPVAATEFGRGRAGPRRHDAAGTTEVSLLGHKSTTGPGHKNPQSGTVRRAGTGDPVTTGPVVEVGGV